MPLLILTVLYRDGPGVAVASGAVLRALNKKCGLERIIRSSYGIVCKEIYDDSLPGHRAAAKSELDIDGEEYIKNSIVWLITKVSIGLKKNNHSKYLTDSRRTGRNNERPEKPI